MFDKTNNNVNTNIYTNVKNTVVDYDNINNIVGDIYDTMVQINNINQEIIEKTKNIYDYSTHNNIEIGNISINLGNVVNSYSEINQYQQEFNTNVKKAETSTESLYDKIKKSANELINMPSMSDILSYSNNFMNMESNISSMNDGGQSNSDLQEKIYGAAMRSRVDINDIIETSGDLSNIGFNNAEAIQYTENLNKLFAIAGTGQEEQENATNAMVESLADGLVNAEELNDMFSTTPEIISAMANNMGISTNEMLSLAEQGQLTSDIIKNSMLGATDSINAEFGNVRATWEDTVTNFVTMATQAFSPVATQINNIINSESVANIMGIVGQGMALIAPILGGIIEGIGTIGGLVLDNFGIIAPIILGVLAVLGAYMIAMGVINTIKGISATIDSITTIATLAHAMATGADTTALKAQATAQQILNATLLACPLTWIVLAIIAVIAAIYLVVAAINKVTGSSLSATGIIAGVIMTAVAVIWNLFLALADFILGIIGFIVNPWISFANFFANLFNDPVASVIYLFRDLAVNVLNVIKTIASGIDKIFGSNLAESVDGWIDGVNNLADKAVEKFGNGKYEQKIERFDITTESLGLERMGYVDSFNSGYEFGEGLTNFSMPDISGGLSDSLGGGLDSSFGGLSNNSFGGTNIGEFETEDYSGLWDGTGVNESTMNNISTSTTNMGSNTYNTAENTFSTTNNSSELVTISKSILEIMQTNMEKENSKPTAQNITVDLSGMNNKFASAEDGETFVNYLTNELIRKMNSSASGVYI